MMDKLAVLDKQLDIMELALLNFISQCEYDTDYEQLNKSSQSKVDKLGKEAVKLSSESVYRGTVNHNN